MRKIIMIVACICLTACGYRITKIDLPEPQIEELRKSYPDIESGHIILYMKKKDKVLDNQEENQD
ncbi:MAG: hypothetical protein K2M30_02610 [Desulfovibrionaceae bacterium]|nr:hypothetical protein [Desulfovibrionaceae bacterium]